MLEQGASAPGLPPQPAPVAKVLPRVGEAEREWKLLDLDACFDHGLLVAYSGKWEKDDAVWSYRARQKVAALEAEARAKEETERKQAEARHAEIREKIACATGRDALFAHWHDDPDAVIARLRSLGFVKVLSLKEGKPISYWLKPGESFRDLDIAPEMVVIPPGEFWMGVEGWRGRG